jgi:hypothetical protein
MHLEFGMAAPQLCDHRHDWRDADTAGDQQMPLGRRVEGKVVAGERDLEEVGDTDALV